VTTTLPHRSYAVCDASVLLLCYADSCSPLIGVSRIAISQYTNLLSSRSPISRCIQCRRCPILCHASFQMDGSDLSGVSRPASPDAWCLGSPIRTIVRHVSFFRRTAQINSRGFETYDVSTFLSSGTPISRWPISRLLLDLRHVSSLTNGPDAILTQTVVIKSQYRVSRFRSFCCRVFLTYQSPDPRNSVPLLTSLMV
jgi:hypothetical protein